MTDHKTGPASRATDGAAGFEQDGPARVSRRGWIAGAAGLAAGVPLVGAALSGGGITGPRPAAAVEPINTPGAKARIRLGLAAYSLRKYLDLKAKDRWTLEKFVEKAAEWDVAGVELTEYYFEKPVTPAAVMAIKRRAYLLGVSVIGTPMGNTFTHPAGPARDKELQRVRDWIDVSADIGSPAIRIFAGTAPKGTDESVARGHVVECLHAVADHAAKRGVYLALENHGGVVAKPEGLLEIVKAVKSDWVGINFDSGNFRTDDPYADLGKIAPWAVAAQFKVALSVAGKKQESDPARVVKILRDAGYRGWLALEYEEAEEPLDAIPRHLDVLRKALA